MIRAGRDADGPAFVQLIETCWREFGDPTCVRDEIADIDTLATSLLLLGGALWSAESSGQLVGMVATYPAEGGWHLARMYVAASHRGTGLARDLLRTAEDYARAAGGTRMILWSDVLFTRAHVFYENHGYVRRGGLRPLHNPAQSIEAGFAKPLAGRVVERLDIAAAESAERPLATILQACTAAGGSFGFLPPLERATALAYWRGVTKAVGSGKAVLLAAWRNGTLAGALHLDLDMPEDARHRADIRTLMVAPGARCRGLTRALLTAAEVAARGVDRSLLIMQTRLDEHAAGFYREKGWVQTGTIPGSLIDAHGASWDTAVYVRRLVPPGDADNRF